MSGLNTKYTYFILAALFSGATAVHAESSVFLKTKNKLVEIEHKIRSLQSSLTHDHKKQNVLHQELAKTEKQISSAIWQLHNTQRALLLKQKEIDSLQHQISELEQKLHVQQKLLAEHLRARFKMGEYQPLKWILNQEDPYQANRLLSFYQYVIHSRQKAISNVHDTKQRLSTVQNQRDTEVNDQRLLQQALNKRQKKLEKDKLYCKTLIQKLDTDIHTQQQKLAEYQRNKDNLSKLLKSIQNEKTIAAQTPFLMMRHKLPRPVVTQSLQKTNQGITFVAPEGKPVTAVYGGRVVFSDWLKGYGLLLIIDHGQGCMTLYARNQSLFKRRGESIRQGEQIATVGHTGGNKENGLYFEVRHRGKAVPPLEWLS